jgi:hypothetical protein
VVLWLPGAAPSVRAARHGARAFVDGAKLVDPDGGVELVVSELATNAVTAVGGDGGVQIRVGFELLAPGFVKVTVWDPTSARPRRRPGLAADPMALGGRGLFLVDAYASIWGVLPQELGKSVWARVPVGLPPWWSAAPNPEP